MAFQPGEQIAQVLALRDYVTDPYLVLATRNGLVKKTRLSEYDSNRSGGLIAVNLREGDELVGVGVASADDDLLLVSVKGAVGPVQGRRQHAAPDGPFHQRRHRDEVPRRRPSSVDECGRAWL